MTLPVSVAVHGAPCVIGAVIVGELRAAFDGEDLLVKDNPKRASDLAEGNLVVFEDQSDRPGGSQPNQKALRTYAFSVGAICRTHDARIDAHALYTRVRSVVLHSLSKLTDVGISVFGKMLVEGDIAYRLENIDVGGGLVLGTFTLEYRVGP